MAADELQGEKADPVATVNAILDRMEAILAESAIPWAAANRRLTLLRLERIARAIRQAPEYPGDHHDQESFSC